MLIERIIAKKIQETIDREPKVIIVYGPRQSGKTTLLGMVSQTLGIAKDKIAFFNGDDLRVQENFDKANLDLLKTAVADRQCLIIDEAQRIPEIGLKIKLLFDNLKMPVILSGSSSFDLAGKASEPLTGRSETFLLYPISLSELKPSLPNLSLENRLEEFLRFGMYPKVLTTEGEQEKENYLYELVSNYLYKDILTFERVRKPKKVVDLLSLLALQIGNEVSIAELGQNLALSKVVVEKYLNVLEKMFVLVNIRGFSRNLRKEIYKTSKYYFVDLGLRNALIRNFNPLKLRQDVGALFENFFLIEKMKHEGNKRVFANFYFWRTYDQKEIDFIEEKAGKLFAYEVKWQDKEVKPPKDWLQNYPNSDFITVSPQNCFEIINQ